MGLGVRFYLFAEGGLQRISQRLMDGLAHGKDAMPQFAGTKQKVANGGARPAIAAAVLHTSGWGYR
jgi:hypothetical protein